MTVKLRGILCSLLLVPLTSSAQQLLEPTPAQAQVTIDILENLTASHYRQRAINDDFSIELFESYLSALDPSKSYFLQSDVNELAKWRTKLDESLQKGDLTCGFDVFNRYRKLAIEQLEKNIDLLESDYAFNFSDDEHLQVNIEQRSWPTSVEERDEWWRQRMEDGLLRLKLSGKETAEARELLAKRYKTQLTQLEETEAEDVFQIYSNTITGLYDPHTNYFSPRTSENFNINMSLSLEGIGAVLQREDEYIKVVRIVPGGPADKQGELKAGDMIIGIAQGEEAENVDLIGWRLDDAVDLIRGPKASTAVLQILPASSDVTTTIKIVRDKVKLEEQAAQSKIIEVPRGESTKRIGVIDIPTFYLDFEAARNGDPNAKSTARDVYNLLKELSQENVDGIILDLRGNGGGSLQEATRLSDLFMDPGPVVQIRNSRNHIDRRQRARKNAFYRGPLVVLIDRLSASASEIFAGAIQDYDRGLLIGSQSFGKGTVQVLLPLREGQLKITESKFYRVSGDSTQNRGVIPDISFPSDYPLDQTGESNEENALPWDTIPPAPYRSFGDFSASIPLLDKMHKERTKTDPDFILLQELIDLRAKYNEVDSQQISLNKETREKVRHEREETVLVLDNKRRKAKGLEPYADVETRESAISELEADTLPLSETDPRLMEAGQILSDMVELYENKTRFVKKK